MNTIIFSNDSPMQLYALLESIKMFCPIITKPTIIYNHSTLDFYMGYIRTFVNFDNIQTIKINNFKQDLIHAIDTDEEHTMFITDNCIFVRPFNSFSLGKETIAFSTLLGKNILKTPNDLSFLWEKQEAPFDTPISFFGHILNTEQCLSWFRKLNYNNFLELETSLSVLNPTIKEKYMKMNKHSCLISLYDLTVNKEDLNEFLLEGKKINIAPYFDLNNDKCIIETSFSFVWR